jgi:modification methylase
MKTTHTLHIGDARKMAAVGDASVHLIVTSPPYPMVEMWDAAFGELVPGVADLLAAERGVEAFEAMHTALDAVWAECLRVLVPGGIACINIGDATRSLGGEFALYPNHARIVSAFMRLGMTPLPDILWRKPTNAPNKFMGSGMLPAGAYVTYEHEYILIFRKGGKRTFSESEKSVRGTSAFFWEERNTWFSDLWTDLKGTGQRLGQDGLRDRSAAFPFELPFRLVNMYALQGDTVLDPFVGTGTTMAAAFAAARNSVGYDRTPELRPVVQATLAAAIPIGQSRAAERLAAHAAFMQARAADGKEAKHTSTVYGFPVVTGQERELRLFAPERIVLGVDGVLVGESVCSLVESSANAESASPAKAEAGAPNANPHQRRKRQPPTPADEPSLFGPRTNG